MSHSTMDGLRAAMSQPQGLGELQTHIGHLRYAVATTDCRATRDALQQMLKEAEAGLERRDLRLKASYAKRL